MKLLGKETFLSLLLHVFLVVAVFAVGSQIDSQSRPVIIFLGANGGGSQAGGGGSKNPVRETRRPAGKGGLHRAYTRSSHSMSPANTKSPNDQPQLQSKQETQETATSERSAKDAGDAAFAAVALGTDDGRSIGRGPGSGGGSGTGSGSAEGGGGSGSGSGTGSLRGYGQGYGEGNARQRYLREHFAYIRDLILKHLAYPPQAKKFGWVGSLTVSFVICEDGITERIRIVKSSGYEILDQNVVRTIKDVQPFPKPPAKAELIIPVMYRLQ